MDTIGSMKIYIATSPYHKKLGIYKVGETSREVECRMREFNGRATPVDQIWYAEKVIDVPNDYTKRHCIDKDLYTFFAKYNIFPMSSSEISAILGDGSRNNETEMFCGHSPEILYALAIEFFKGYTLNAVQELSSYVPLTNWSTDVVTPMPIAYEMVSKLNNHKLFQKLHDRNSSFSICDIACKDASIVNASIKLLYNVLHLERKDDATSDLIKLMSKHIYAYCLDRKYVDIKNHIIQFISSAFKNVDPSAFSPECEAFVNIHSSFSESESKYGTINQLNILSMKKFDAIVINPPYANGACNMLHLDFTKAALSMANQVISLFPITFIFSNTKPFKDYKSEFSPRLLSVSEVSSHKFKGTHMVNVGIYEFSRNGASEGISISLLDSAPIVTKSLVGFNKFNSIEQEVIDLIKSRGSIKTKAIHAGACGSKKNSLDMRKQVIVSTSANLKNYLDLHPGAVGLVVSEFNGKGDILTKKNGKMFDNYKDFEDFFIQRNTANGYKVIMFDSKVAAKNFYKSVLERPLVNYLVRKVQHSQRLNYDLIPDINWELVKSDEDILIQCGCPENKLSGFLDIVDEFMYRVKCHV